MNFFSGSSNLFPSKMNNQNNWTSSKGDHITQLIRSCTYGDEIKFIIEKSVRQLLHVYPQYRADKIQFMENNFQRRFVELKGEISVDLKGSVPLHIMYPAGFPNTPPFFRLVNANPSQMTATALYLPLQSKNDMCSYILNASLQQVNTWKTGSTVVSVIIEVSDLVRNNFPFQMFSANQFGNQHQSWGSDMSSHQNYPKQGANKHNSWSGEKPKEPPIPFKVSTTNASQLCAKGQSYVTMQKEKLSKISQSHVVLLGALQTLDTSKKALESQSSMLMRQTENMMQFVRESDQKEQGDLSNLVRTTDEFSQKILNLSSSIKAREDTIQMLESKFNDEEIGVQEFLKHIRKVEEGRFEDRFKLLWCLQNASRIMV